MGWFCGYMDSDWTNNFRWFVVRQGVVILRFTAKGKENMDSIIAKVLFGLFRMGIVKLGRNVYDHGH